MVIEVQDYIDAALLLALGFALEKAEMGQYRVVFFFDDPERRAAEVLLEHDGHGVDVNSSAFARGLREAKDTLFRVRRRAGAERCQVGSRG